MKIPVTATMSPEYLYELGKKYGLSDEAANYFRYCESIEIELHVDPENGAVCGANIASNFE